MKLYTVGVALNVVSGAPASTSLNATSTESKQNDSKSEEKASKEPAESNKQTKEKIETPRSYASLFKSNRDIAQAEKLTYYPEIVKGKLEISEADIALVSEEWSATLIGVVTGNPLPYYVVKKYVETNWNVRTPKIILKDNGVFIFKFYSGEDRDEVMKMGEWNVDGTRPLLLKQWEPGMQIEWEEFDAIPTWVCFPNIEPHMCNNLMLSKLGSSVGKPLCMDSVTAACDRLSYARILIEIKPEEAMIREVEITTHNKKVYKQQVVFEWLPLNCKTCNKFGHDTTCCPKTRQNSKAPARQVWIPKTGPVIQNEKKTVEESIAGGGSKDERVVPGSSYVIKKGKGKMEELPTGELNVDVVQKEGISCAEIVDQRNQNTHSKEEEEGWTTRGKKKTAKAATVSPPAGISRNLRSKFDRIRGESRRTVKQLLQELCSDEEQDLSEDEETDDDTYDPDVGYKTTKGYHVKS